jgi:hypothetical protein
VTDETKEVGKILDKIAYQVVDMVDKPPGALHYHHQEWCIKNGNHSIWIKQWDNGFTCDFTAVRSGQIIRGMDLLEVLAEKLPWIAKFLAEPMP